MTNTTAKQAKRSFSIAEVTGGKCEIVATRVTEKDAIKQAHALMEALGGEFRSVATAAARTAGLIREAA